MCQWWQAKHSLYLGASCVVVGTLLSLTALTAPYWRVGDGVTEGLYYFCVDGSCDRLPDNVQGDSGQSNFSTVLLDLYVN